MIQERKPQRAIVTGGAGFIGSHLVDRLLAADCEVIVLDNMSTGRPENLAHLAGDSRITLHRVDIADHAAILPHFCEGDWVFHLAALADIVPSMERPLDYAHSNVTGTTSVVEAARQAGAARFVYAASSSCYGIPGEYPTPETAPIRPQYPYALTKNIGEQIVMHWAQVFRLPSVALRLFNVYGPRSRTAGTYGAVFGVFLAQKLAGKPFTIVGDGTQTRDFTYVTDVADAFYRAAVTPIDRAIINIGSGQAESVNRLVELLQGPSVHIPKRPGEPDITHADISRARELLHWSPTISLEAGVAMLLDEIEYWRSAPVWTTEAIHDATKPWFQYLGAETEANAKAETR